MSKFIQGISIFRIETGICILATWGEVSMKKRKYLILKTNLTCDFPELRKSHSLRVYYSSVWSRRYIIKNMMQYKEENVYMCVNEHIYNFIFNLVS